MLRTIGGRRNGWRLIVQGRDIVDASSSFWASSSDGSQMRLNNNAISEAARAARLRKSHFATRSANMNKGKCCNQSWSDVTAEAKQLTHTATIYALSSG